MNYLGIDYGTKRLGLALATTPLAEPLATISNNSRAIIKIRRLCQRHCINQIIIGVPEGQLNTPTRQFAQKLKQSFNLPIIFHHETLTSQQAKIKTLHKKRSQRTKPQDAYQASLILQDYLDAHPARQPLQT
jgi:putative Holliday junction resolvase